MVVMHLLKLNAKMQDARRHSCTVLLEVVMVCLDLQEDVVVVWSSTDRRERCTHRKMET